jgi:hypothetical protein
LSRFNHTSPYNIDDSNSSIFQKLVEGLLLLFLLAFPFLDLSTKVPVNDQALLGQQDFVQPQPS